MLYIKPYKLFETKLGSENSISKFVEIGDYTTTIVNHSETYGDYNVTKFITINLLDAIKEGQITKDNIGLKVGKILSSIYKWNNNGGPSLKIIYTKTERIVHQDISNIEIYTAFSENNKKLPISISKDKFLKEFHKILPPELIKEGYNEIKHLLLKKNKAESSNTPPIEGGVVLIYTNPYPDGLKRIFMGIIDRIREDNDSTTTRVDLNTQYYLLKEYSGGLIMPDKMQLNDYDRKKYLNMNTNGLYLKEAKTPLWRTSSSLTKLDFFTKCQTLLKSIEGVTFFKSSKELPRLD